MSLTLSKTSIYLILNVATGCFSCQAQSVNYSAKLNIKNYDNYRQEIKTHPESRLIEILPDKTGIKLDIRYATSNNFMGRPMYLQARAFVRLPVYNALLAIQKELNKQALGLKIFDGYRPYSITVKFYEMAKDTTFVADPRKGSRHNLGAAVDLTIIDIKTGKELEMPTGYDSFSKAAAANYPDITPAAAKNRALLQSLMQAHGFQILPSEWWHFDFADRNSFELLDVPFDKL